MESQREREFWLRISGKRVIVGLTEEGIRKVADANWLRLPKMGVNLKAGDDFVIFDSGRKKISLSSPLTGQVVEINWELAQNPELAVEERWLAIFIPTDEQ